MEPVKAGTFACRYALGEIVEMKQHAADMFCGQVKAVTFCEDSPPQYLVRRTDGVLLGFSETELCVMGVDYERPNPTAKRRHSRPLERPVRLSDQRSQAT